MKTIALLAVAAATISACASAPLPPLNMASSELTALVRGDCKYFRLGSNGYEPDSRSETLFMAGSNSLKSAGRREIIVDSGPVVVMARCAHQAFFGGPIYSSARFDFTAEQGHTYEITNDQEFEHDNYECLKLLDVSADSREIMCEHQFRGGYADNAVSENTAQILETGFLARHMRSCRIWDEIHDKSVGYLRIDSGPISFEVQCEVGYAYPRKRRVRMDFVAKAGHTYTISLPDNTESKTCVGLSDASADEIVVECKSFD